ncbi:MAG: glycoside hydrolase family 13 protein [Oscillospiraceae bacterium]|nr:glycoside hydrolase family 13 protein [Oscillospiraceae bacterium]
MYIFDETNAYFRNPIGAIETPGTLTLQIKLRRGELVNPRCCLHPDDGNASETAMDYDHASGIYDVYKVTLQFEQKGLFWYHFLVDNARDSNKAVRIPENDGDSFQITVCVSDLVQPEWIWGGTIYHIFVDRFCGDWQMRTAPGAIHRYDWGGCPYFLPDEHGIVRNNDFFGGNLYGVIEKLPYLEKLGVTCIYLSPIFEADSNHKYDTADFMKVDEAFGGDDALEKLCKEADAHGMNVILDGVFNHVGCDSVYFNRYGKYDSIGAYQSKDSVYRDWFNFHDDGTYDSWWGIELLPALNKSNPQYKDFLCGDDGVIAHWTKKGVAGWRLDVVDEIPDILLDPLCQAMRREKSDSYIVGEVWEDASNKIAYSHRRRYFQGGQLNSVTNYPLKDAIIESVISGDVTLLADIMASLTNNYPKNVLDSLINILGTHDTMRILTALSGAQFPEGKPAMSHFKLTEEQRELAKKRLKLASTLQFFLPGVPCVYYGDEAGMEGGADPFSRRCYPWGEEDQDILSWYRTLAKIRKNQRCFTTGTYKLIEAREGIFAFTRSEGDEHVLVAINLSDTDRILNVPTFNSDLIKKVAVDEIKIKSYEAGIFS